MPPAQWAEAIIAQHRAGLIDHFWLTDSDDLAFELQLPKRSAVRFCSAGLEDGASNESAQFSHAGRDTHLYERRFGALRGGAFVHAPAFPTVHRSSNQHNAK